MRIVGSQMRADASFDLTPMIDVVFLLIIFFSMTSQFSESHFAPMDLPRERGEAGPADAAASLVIDLALDGTATIGGQQYAPADLRAYLETYAKSAAKGPKSIDVIVRADRRGPTSNLDALARALADAGILHWKLATASSSAP
jgi:biopolymer transport protein ExbD